MTDKEIVDNILWLLDIKGWEEVTRSNLFDVIQEIVEDLESADQTVKNIEWEIDRSDSTSSIINKIRSHITGVYDI